MEMMNLTYMIICLDRYFVTSIEFLFGNRMELLVYCFVTRKELFLCN